MAVQWWRPSKSTSPNILIRCRPAGDFQASRLGYQLPFAVTWWWTAAFAELPIWRKLGSCELLRLLQRAARDTLSIGLPFFVSWKMGVSRSLSPIIDILNLCAPWKSMTMRNHDSTSFPNWFVTSLPRLKVWLIWLTIIENENIPDHWASTSLDMTIIIVYNNIYRSVLWLHTITYWSHYNYNILK